MHELKLRYTENSFGMSTEAQYKDDAGWSCATRMAGWLNEATVRNHVMSCRARTGTDKG